MPSRVGTGLSTCLFRPSLHRRPHGHPLPDGEARFRCSMASTTPGWAAKGSPDGTAPVPQGGPRPAGPAVCLARLLHLPHPVLSRVGHQGQPCGQEAQMKEGSGGHSWGPPSPETGWAPVAPPPVRVWSGITPQPAGSGRGVQEQLRVPWPRSSLTRASLFARLWPLLAPPPTRLLPACLLPAQPDSTRGASSLSSGLQSPNRVWASLGLQG